MEKAVLDLSGRAFAPGLNYVVVSRVKSLRGVMFKEPFDLESLRPNESETTRMRKQDLVRREVE